MCSGELGAYMEIVSVNCQVGLNPLDGNMGHQVMEKENNKEIPESWSRLASLAHATAYCHRAIHLIMLDKVYRVFMPRHQQLDQRLTNV